MKKQIRATRRDFLRGAMAAGAAISLPHIVPARVLGREGAVAPSNKTTLGVIGIGPRCTYDMNAILKLPDVRCLAIADVQATRRDNGKRLVDTAYGNKDCALYHDFRELLARKDIDAVIIATGDRWHAPASMMAAKAGKDVYSEKPCGLTIALCQQLAATMKQTARVFQAGTQRRSVANFVQAVQLAHSGKLGKLHTLRASVYLPELGNNWLPGEATPPRDVVDWNLWLGPAPWRPYNKQYVAGKWRGYFDFDSGAKLLDWGAHTVDLCQWANQADDTMPIEYVPAKDNITAHYANGVKLVMEFLQDPFGRISGKRPEWTRRLGTCPVQFIGDEGSVETGDDGVIEVNPPSLKSELKKLSDAAPSVFHTAALTNPAKPPKGKKKPPKKQPGLDVDTHARNFFDCIKTRAQTAANPQVMMHSHIACHAAAWSWILNRKLAFDPAKLAFINDDEANGLRSRPARDPFNL